MAETFADENDTLREQMCQTEKDTIDVISYLKKQDLEKDTEVKLEATILQLVIRLQIEHLEDEVETLAADHQKDKEELVRRRRENARGTFLFRLAGGFRSSTSPTRRSFEEKRKRFGNRSTRIESSERISKEKRTNAAGA